ncbi:hypothetical protein pb186bvf_015600 [Paramecium bursaria]
MIFPAGIIVPSSSNNCYLGSGMFVPHPLMESNPQQVSIIFYICFQAQLFSKVSAKQIPFQTLLMYDEEQVRIRYLVQIDTQNQEDKFL